MEPVAGHCSSKESPTRLCRHSRALARRALPSLASTLRLQSGMNSKSSFVRVCVSWT